jgi:two-component system, LuxR family, response regulator FixJ
MEELQMPAADERRQIVHIIDDDETVREVVTVWLSRLGLTVKAYTSADQFLATYQPSEVECLLLDLRMPGVSGLDLQEMLGAHQIQLPLIVISAVDDTATVVRAMSHGAIEFLEKPLDEQRVRRAVTEALASSRETNGQKADLTLRIDQLSPREREVLSLLAAAKTTPEIAAALAIRPKTVEKYRHHIFQQLEVDNVPALIQLMQSLRR